MHVTWHPRNQTEHPLSWHVPIVLHQTVLWDPSARHALSGSRFATHQCPQQFCIPFVASTWHCFPPVPSASVLQPVLVQQICLVLLLCSRNPWQSETCVDQLGDILILDFQPISTNLSRKLSRWSRQFDQQSESQCAYLIQHPRCSAPSVSSSHEEMARVTERACTGSRATGSDHRATLLKWPRIGFPRCGFSSRGLTRFARARSAMEDLCTETQEWEMDYERAVGCSRRQRGSGWTGSGFLT